MEENERYLSDYLRQKEEVLRERAQRLMQIGRLKQSAAAMGKQRREGKENSQGNRVHTSNSRSRSKKSTITQKGMNNLLMR